MRLIRVDLLAALLAGLSLVAAPAAAQTTSASVSGTVVDSSRAVLPGATVTLTSQTQGNALTAMTDAEGRFVFPIVRPDAYVAQGHAARASRPSSGPTWWSARTTGSSAGILTLEVGALHGGGQRHRPASASCRRRAASARSRWRARRSRTSPTTAARCSTSRPSCRASCRRTRAAPEIAQVSGFTVNGQRPNSNNMTIDGVANIDTGDNGGNMATTNIDAVAEFKILTNAYQAEYGRAVGGQVQVVTKSGTQAFHGSGYWYGRRSDWNANTWTNKRAEAPAPVGNGKLIEPPESSRDDYGYTIGGPIYIPGVFNADKKKLFFFWSQEFQKRKDPRRERATPRCPPRSSARATSRRASTAAATRSPTSATTRRGCPAARPTRAAASRTAACSAGSRRTASTRPASTPSTSSPTPNFTAASGVNYTSQVPNDAPRREDLIRAGLPAHGQVARHRPLHEHQGRHRLQAYGTTWAGNGSDQLPMPVALPAPRQELDGLAPPASSTPRRRSR